MSFVYILAIIRSIFQSLKVIFLDLLATSLFLIVPVFAFKMMDASDILAKRCFSFVQIWVMRYSLRVLRVIILWCLSSIGV